MRGVIILLGVPLAALAASPPPKRVLALYDATREFSNIQSLDENIEGTIRFSSPHNILIYREYMDLTRIGQPNYEQTLKNYYREKFANDRPDVIIAVRSRALDFLLKYSDEIFPDVPIVSVGMDLRQVRARTLPPRVTGVALRVSYQPTLALALSLRPETGHVAVVNGASPSDQALLTLVRDEFAKIEHPPEINYLVGLAWDDLRQKLATLPANSVVLFVSLARDGTGRAFEPNDAIRRISRIANAPTFVASDDVINAGAVGGNVFRFGGLGQNAATLALRILAGESPSAIPFSEYSTRSIILDARELERWNIPANRVPAAAEIRYREPTLWATHRWQIVAGLALTVSVGTLGASLLLMRNRRREAQRALEISETRKRAAVLEERNRLARDIHDSLAQGFAGVIIQLGAARKAFAQASAADAHQHIQRAEETARQSLGEARRSIQALRPRELERGDLPQVLAALMRKMTAETAVRAEFTVSGEPRALHPSVEENLLRIEQEMLTNALKHSGATTIVGRLSFELKDVRLEMRDNGTGFDPAGAHRGFGLIGIRERVEQMCGQLAIQAEPSSGTCLSVVLPIDGGARRAQQS